MQMGGGASVGFGAGVEEEEVAAAVMEEDAAAEEGAEEWRAEAAEAARAQHRSAVRAVVCWEGCSTAKHCHVPNTHCRDTHCQIFPQGNAAS